jgi:hypothetical protein
MNPDEAIANAHDWFEHHSGWAPPDPDTLLEWAADGVCRCPDDCLATPDGWCAHGLASWWLIMSDLNKSAHDQAVARHAPGYIDLCTGLYVLTSQYLADRASCCEQGCRHCPY